MGVWLLHAGSLRMRCMVCPVQDWRLYIIQEFCDGGTLRRALDLKAFNDPSTHAPRLVRARPPARLPTSPRPRHWPCCLQPRAQAPV